MNAPPTVPVPASEPPRPEAPPSGPRMGYRLAMADSATEARQGIAPLLALTNLIIWAVNTYVFHGSAPVAVSGALYIIVPAVIGYLATHVTIKKVTL